MSTNDEFMNEEFPESEKSQSPDAENQPEQKKDWRQTLFKDLKDILVILGVFMLVYVLFFRAVVVVGNSMNNTLIDGDRLLLISGLLYQNPEQGDVIVACKDSFRDGEPIVKRVIATEGQTVDIDFKTGTVYVDGAPLYEDYISTPTTDDLGTSLPLTVPEGCVFVMGDNRGNSLDSRSPQIGLVNEGEILGKVIFLMIPGTNKGTEPFDLSRIGVVD